MTHDHQPKTNSPNLWNFMAKQPDGVEFLTSHATGPLLPDAEDFAAVDHDMPLPADPALNLLAYRKQQATAHKLIRLFAQWKVEQTHATLEIEKTLKLPALEPKPRMTFAQVIQRYTEGVRDFSEVIVEGELPHHDNNESNQQVAPDLTGINLWHANLRRLNLNRVSLRAANLAETNLCGASFEQSDLSYANLRNANLSSAWLQGADLRGADLRGAWFDQVFLDGGDLRGADLLGASLNAAWVQLTSLRVDDHWQTYLRRFSLHPYNEAEPEMRLYLFHAQQIADER